MNKDLLDITTVTIRKTTKRKLNRLKKRIAVDALTKNPTHDTMILWLINKAVDK